ncbi:MAG: family 20 glycosylhydrolase [Clostridia bacterium]|nr:family 20 glycosylhydrolase [Clostridia bacterium]
MIYPIPVSQKISDEKSNVKPFDTKNSVLDFYRAAKDFDINFISSPCFAKEEYKLVIDKNSVSIFSSCDEGTYRALTSLRQLCINSEDFLPICEIEDKPDFERRSYMLDISRSKIPTLDFLKDLIDTLTDLKYNEFQLYMDSFCYKFEAFPEYTKGIDCLTPEDLDILDEYCAERFIDLVPNQNSLGHMAHWLKKPELEHLAIMNDGKQTGTLNPLDEGSIELMDKIYASLFPHFRSKYAHVGLDEAYGLGLGQTKEACEKYGMDSVFADYLHKINDLCAKYGKEVMYWDDMIISNPESFKKFPQNAIAVEWGYGIISTQFMENRCRTLAEAGARFYVAPGTAEWECITSRTGVMEFNNRTAAELGKKYGAMGYMITDWGMPTDGHMQHWVNSYFPMAMAGQYAWNAGAPQDRQNFKHEFRFGAFDYLDKNIFGAKGVTEELYRLGKYYHLEPHKVHGMTLSTVAIFSKLDSNILYNTIINPFPVYDFDRFTDTFDFENVIGYVESIQKRFEKIDFEPTLKKEVLLTCRMIKMGARIAILKIEKAISPEEKKNFLAEIDSIMEEHVALWKNRNFENGVEVSLGLIKARRDEIEEMY